MRKRKASGSRGARRRITAWSFSRWSTYEGCPARAFSRFIERRSEPQGKAAARGQAIHEKAEAYVKAPRAPRLPEELALFRDEFRALRRAATARRGVDVRVEEQWAFTSTWKPTGWFDPDAWCRVKVDAVEVELSEGRARVIDHKTGQVRPDQTQLELYAAAVLLVFPEVDEVAPEFWYLDHGDIIGAEEPYRRAQLDALLDRWERRTQAMLTDTRFAPTPGPACRWCAFAKDKGGPCRF